MKTTPEKMTEAQWATAKKRLVRNSYKSYLQIISLTKI